MALKRDKRPIGDPAVDAHLGGDPIYGELSEETRKRRSRTDRQRKQARRDATRNKKTYDLPVDISGGVERLADQLGVPTAHVAAALLRYGLEAVELGNLDLVEMRVVSSHPRFDYFLDLENDD